MTKAVAGQIYLLVSTVLLVAGVGLNYVLTGGKWWIRTSTRRFSNQYLEGNAYDLTTAAILLVSLILLGLGFLLRSRAKHGLRAAGFVLFGFYWATQAMKLYYAEEGDFVNALFGMLAVFFFNYFAYHELLSLQRNEDPRSLRWLTGTAFITTGVYFVTHKVQLVAEWLILRVSEQTQWLLVALGQGTVRCGGEPEGSLIYYPTNPAFGCSSDAFFAIQIILACTAVQSIMIFLGGIFALRPPRMGEGVSGKVGVFEALRTTYAQRRVWALVLTVPLIYVLNLFRNVIIIWMSGQEEAVLFASNNAAFWFSHNIIGKGGSLLALILIAFIVFQILPELYDSIIGLLDLKQRGGPLDQWLSDRFGRRGNGGLRGPKPATAPAAPAPPGADATPDLR